MKAKTATAATTLDPLRIVEAALFSAGKPLSLDEIAENTGIPRPEAKKLVEALRAEYAERPGAFEIAKAGEKWAMQVRAEYASATTKLAPMEVAPKLLKTLALIAYHQPLLQSQLVDMVGAKAYEHVHELYERGLVKRRVHERSFMLLTTETFPEYFGIPAANRDEIKTYLAEKVGIPLPKTDGKGNRKLDAIPDRPASPA